MSRVKRGFKRKRRTNKILKLAKGFHFDRRNKIRHAMPTVERALAYAYKSRRLLKRDMRQLWITRINAAIKPLGLSYSKFLPLLEKANIGLNRKMLAELAARDLAAFQSIVKKGTA
jgi:large subunit ribosomal protein L20